MRRRITKAIAVVAIATPAVLIPLTSASAAPVDTRLHGPYATQNACVNARLAVAVSGRHTTPCAQTFLPASYDWFFWSSS
ncbi:hypothetical protein ACGFNU_32685 [Spirillospora sp. NPDC048911]|uniref:hypothetical protein n=1 Tax=Spirillospora sp. NPDC048911 TaxID=3364527 RepID=UPI00371A3996